MNPQRSFMLAASAGLSVTLPFWVTTAAADVPCGGDELDECRVYIEINATDGDIGFHVLMDAEGWVWARITDPGGQQLFKEDAKGALEDQTLTENFFESDEPLCQADPEEPDAEVVTLSEFLARFPQGMYEFKHKLPNGGMLAGWTELSHALPAAPTEIDFDGSVISWEAGDDLGECEPDDPSGAGDVPIIAYQVVFEPDVDAEDPSEELSAAQIFSAVVPGDPDEEFDITVPAEYLAAFEPDTPAKVEIIAIEMRDNGSFGNQVAAEEDGFCVNVDEGCDDD